MQRLGPIGPGIMLVARLRGVMLVGIELDSARIQLA